MIAKHYELYQPRLVKQLAKMKRSAAHLTVSVRRLSEENDSLRKELSAAKELLAAKSGMNKIGSMNEAGGMNDLGSMKTGDPAPELDGTAVTTQLREKQFPQPAERPADKSNSRGWRLLTYFRRTRQ
jgi:hypothetical protein